MFVRKKKLVRVLGRNLAYRKMLFDSCDKEGTEVGFELCNNYANQMEAIIQIAKEMGVISEVADAAFDSRDIVDEIGS